MSNPFVLAVMRAMRGKLPKPSETEKARAPNKTASDSGARRENTDMQPGINKSETQD